MNAKSPKSAEAAEAAEKAAAAEAEAKEKAAAEKAEADAAAEQADAEAAAKASDEGKLRIRLAKELGLAVAPADKKTGRKIPADMILAVTEHDSFYGVVTVDGRKHRVAK